MLLRIVTILKGNTLKDISNMFKIWPIIDVDKLTVGARGVIVMVIGNGHGDTSGNPGRDW